MSCRCASNRARCLAFQAIERFEQSHRNLKGIESIFRRVKEGSLRVSASRFQVSSIARFKG